MVQDILVIGNVQLDNFLKPHKLSHQQHLAGKRSLPFCISLPWRHNERHGVSNHWRQDCLLNRFFRHRSCEKTGEFPAQRASYAGNVSIWWRHHVSKSKMTFKMAASTKDSKWWAVLVTSSPISVIFLSLYGFFLGFSWNILGNIWIPNRDDMSIREYLGSTYQWKCSWKWQNMILMYWNNLHWRLTFEIIA